MKKLKKTGIILGTVLLVGILIYVPNVFAANTVSGDVFITCDEKGNIRPTDKKFTQATITISNLDNSGRYIYYGVDIGVFEKTAEGDFPTLYLKRVVTNSLNINITDFGDITKYRYDKVYVLGYRVLYQPVGSSGQIIVENAWKMVPNSYFRIYNAYISATLHNQIINYYYDGIWKKVEVPSPNESGLVGGELKAYEGFNTFIDGDIVKYKFIFSVTQSSNIEDIAIDLIFNSLSEPGVELSLLDAKLGMVGKGILKDIDITRAKIDKNKYTLNLGNNNMGTPILNANGDGTYYIEYTCRLIVENNSAVNAIVRNEVRTIVISKSRGNIVQLSEGFGYKNYIDTKIYKNAPIYR